MSTADKEETQAKTALDIRHGGGRHTAATAESDAARQVDEGRRHTSRRRRPGRPGTLGGEAGRSKVDKARGKAYAPAFTAWQMAAIADRVGQARVVRAKQQASDAARLLEAADTALSAASAARTQAEDRMARAAAQAKVADERLAAARTERAAAREQLAALRAEKPRVLVALAKATSQAKGLRGELAVLTRREAKARAEAARAGTPTPKVTP